jgi:hypothetical protein
VGETRRDYKTEDLKPEAEMKEGWSRYGAYLRGYQIGNLRL